MKTIQEKTWKGKFGANYSIRNKGIKKNFLRKIIDKKIKIKSVFEFGTNIGNNLDIIKSINKNTLTSGVEINQFASEIARKKGHKIINKSIFELENAKKKFDLTMTIGVLIHINPHQLKFIYKKLFEYSKKYILICEYFNDKPVTIKYRGKFNLLFKRDFAKEIKDKYNLKIVDYGFVWSEDKNYNMDNYNWFLLKKK